MFLIDSKLALAKVKFSKSTAVHRLQMHMFYNVISGIFGQKCQKKHELDSNANQLRKINVSYFIN